MGRGRMAMLQHVAAQDAGQGDVVEGGAAEQGAGAWGGAVDEAAARAVRAGAGQRERAAHLRGHQRMRGVLEAEQDARAAGSGR